MHSIDRIETTLRGRRTPVAELLSEGDLETLKHVARQGTPANSMKALAQDLRYLEAWAVAATGAPLPWPAPPELALKFLAHHLYDPVTRAQDPGHGMPAEVEAALVRAGVMARPGPPAASTVKRRLASWATLHRLRGLASPFSEESFRMLLRRAVNAIATPARRKSARPLTRALLRRLLATCDDGLLGSRDRALLLVAFASGGRRRSEIARLGMAQLLREANVPLRPKDPQSPSVPCFTLALGRTKTTTADAEAAVKLVGAPASALIAWLAKADITEGPVFRRVLPGDRIGEAPIAPETVNLVVKRRAAQAGIDPESVSAHGLRSGYLTQAARDGIALPAAMRFSQHRSLQQAARYYTAVELELDAAARLAEEE